MMEDLPFDPKEKFSILKRKFPDVDDNILLQLCSKVHFLVDAPLFVFTWIEDYKIQTMSVCVQTQPICHLISITRSESLYVVYSINNKDIRGQYVKDWEGKYSKMRDKKIDEIINE